MEIEDEIEIGLETIVVKSDHGYLKEELVKVHSTQDTNKKYLKPPPLAPKVPFKLHEVYNQPPVPMKKPKRYGCRICRRLFRNPYEVEVHMNSHSDARNFHCELCTKSFKYKRSLRMHIQKFHPPQPNTSPKTFTCPKCSTCFYSYGNLLAHIKVHSQEQQSPFVCKLCGKAFMYPFTLKRHERKDHEEQIEVKRICYPGVKKEASPPDGDEDDDVLFVKEYQYEETEEKEVSNEEEEQVEDECIPVEVEIIEPVSESSEEEETICDVNEYICRFCERRFGTKYQLDSHIEMHLFGEKVHMCMICSINFQSKSNLDAHMSSCHANDKSRSKSNVRRYVCPMCSKVCPSNNKLEAHKRCHTLEKPYQCFVCSKRFNDKGNLNKHMVVHSPARPYVCKICNISFKRQPMYKKHMFQRHGELGTYCPYCGESVFGNLNMKSHIKSQHRGLPVAYGAIPSGPTACTVCGEQFDTFDQLREHARKYLPLQYVCKICLKTFPEEYRITRHFARVHMSEEGYSNMTIDEYSTVIEMAIE